MNRQEPYIGMPIILGDFDDEPVTCCGQTELQPRPAEPTAPARREAAEDRREQMHHDHEQMQNQMQHNQGQMQHTQNMQPMALAMAYVPWQKWTSTYPLDEGLHKGTIFPDLDLPFEGRKQGGMRR